MKAEDFKIHDIRHFSAYEVTKTGASLECVELETILRLDNFRDVLGIPCHLVHNGLTTGEHTAIQHAQGKAVDIIPLGLSDYKQAVYTAILAGFTGIGLYHNGLIYQMHLDLRPFPAMWIGVKKQAGTGKWHMFPMIIDPKELIK